MENLNVRITNILQHESNYNEQGGNFTFELSEEVNDEWEEIFRDNAGNARFGFSYKPTPAMKRKNAISAFASIDGEGDIPSTANDLKLIIETTNNEYNKMIDERNKKAAEQERIKNELDQKVKDIIGKIEL